ncbi:hypothetical protein J4V27_24800, partial [Escherichia coli]
RMVCVIEMVRGDSFVFCLKRKEREKGWARVGGGRKGVKEKKKRIKKSKKKKKKFLTFGAYFSIGCWDNGFFYEISGYEK